MKTINKCRLCLYDNIFKMEDIFEGEIQGVPYNELLFKLFDIKVQKADNFPKSVCCNCVNFMKFFCKTKLEFQENQIKLQMLLKNNNLNAPETGKEGLEEEEYIKVRLADLEKMNRLRISVKDEMIFEKLKRNNLYNLRRNLRKKKKLQPRKNYLNYYYEKETLSIRELIKSKNEKEQRHSKSLKDVRDQYKITTEKNYGEMCVIESWSDSFCRNLFDTNSAYKIFTCKYCSRMFTLFRELRLHEECHTRLDERIRAQNDTLPADNGWFTKARRIKQRRKSAVFSKKYTTVGSCP